MAQTLYGHALNDLVLNEVIAAYEGWHGVCSVLGRTANRRHAQ